MDSYVFAAVLFAAACHAGWNAFIKFGLEPFTATTLVALGSGAVALPMVAAFGAPAPPSWPWLAGSVVFHIGYYAGLTGAYRAGDMSQVYPIARGSAPLATAALSIAVFGERLPPLAYVGIAILAGGVVLMSLRGGADIGHLNKRAVGFALFTSITITGYSLVDGAGARASGNPHAYTAMLFLLDGIAMLIIGFAVRGSGLAVDALRNWKGALIAGGLSVIAYWIAIWAMTVAPIAMVAALRETSVLFAAVIAIVVLKEPLRPIRLAAALLIVSGLAIIRLA
jgi:drug/metabolite transporter (DMT)-like permease